LVRKYAQENNNIIYLGRVPPSDVPRFTAACDIVYYGFDETNPNAKWSAPNKLFEAIAAGKAILTGHFGEIGKIVRVSGCGVLADTRTRVGIASALESLTAPGALLDMKQASVTIQGRLSRSHAQERLTEAYMTVLCER
jgi:glycosyltransferase involved in cell wall biosynthesis